MIFSSGGTSEMAKIKISGVGRFLDGQLAPPGVHVALSSAAPEHNRSIVPDSITDQTGRFEFDVEAKGVSDSTPGLHIYVKHDGYAMTVIYVKLAKGSGGVLQPAADATTILTVVRLKGNGDALV
jgi:hypothetical protein